MKNMIPKIRTAVANYMSSEGCGCCGNGDKHRIDTMVLAMLLKVPKYKDGSGYDFGQFEQPCISPIKSHP